MVGRWSPDPPPEPENIVDHELGYVMVFAAASDEEEADEGYEGYEPLSDVDFGTDSSSDSEDDAEDQPPNVAAAGSSEQQITLTASSITHGDVQNDIELDPSDELSGDSLYHAGGLPTGGGEGAVCPSGPGPSHTRLELGEQQVAQVMAAMANISLPPSAVPHWAAVVPEDQWMQHMLSRIHHLQDKDRNSD